MPRKYGNGTVEEMEPSSGIKTSARNHADPNRNNLNTQVLWDVKSRRLLGRDRRFGGEFYLHPQGQSVQDTAIGISET